MRMILIASVVVLSTLGFQNCSDSGLPDTSNSTTAASAVPSNPNPFLIPPPVPQPTAGAQPQSQLVMSSFTELATYHPACNSSAPSGSGCMVAASRLCHQKMGLAGGYGVVEYNGDATQIVCLKSATSLTVSFSTQLAAQHPGCTSGTAATMPACYAASNRYCISKGYAGGLGVLEFNNDSAQIFCFSSAVLAATDLSIDKLETYLNTCLISNPTDVTCLAASKRYCVAQGFSAGYGMVEESGTTGQVNCLK